MGRGANLEATMPAHVVMDAQLTGSIAHDDQGIGAELHREMVAGFCDLALMAGEDPRDMEDAIQVEIEQVTVGIEFLRQRVARLPIS
jgi:hypothetical protein